MTDPDMAGREAALAEIATDPRLGPIYAHWQRLAGESALPKPSDIDPMDLPRATLPYLTLFDVIDAGRDFRIRLVGTASVQAVGGDYTGKYLDALMSGQALTTALDRYRTVIAHRRPVFGCTEYRMRDGSSFRNLLITLPLSSDGAMIDRLLGVYSPQSAWLARRTLHNLDPPPDVTVTQSQIVL